MNFLPTNGIHMLNTIIWITQNYFVNSRIIKIKEIMTLLKKKYYFYSRVDSTQEPIMSAWSFSRIKAAEYFAEMKQLDLKSFLSIFAVSK
jgi:hypothetical protein